MQCLFGGVLDHWLCKLPHSHPASQALMFGGRDGQERPGDIGKEVVFCHHGSQQGRSGQE